MDVDKNLKEWSLATKQYLLHARLITNASDAHAGDVFYHLDCYTHLRYEANKAASSTFQQSQSYDPFVIAQLVLHMTESREVFKLATLQNLYKKRMQELDHSCESL